MRDGLPHRGREYADHNTEDDVLHGPFSFQSVCKHTTLNAELAEHAEKSLGRPGPFAPRTTGGSKRTRPTLVFLSAVSALNVICSQAHNALSEIELDAKLEQACRHNLCRLQPL